MSFLNYFNPFSFFITPIKAEYKAISSFEHLIKTLNNDEELDEIIKDIAAYEGQSIELGSENFRNFCLEQLNLNLQGRSDHQYVYSNILSHYNFNDKRCSYNYSEKELILLVIAANDQLTKKYENILFAKENLSLLPLLVGGKEYISIFIKKFPDLYQDLKEQRITLPGNQTIGFFSVIALRKEPEFLNAVFLQYVFNDLKKELQEAKDDLLYGILETAALIENKGFIEIILNSIEKCINEQGEKELLKSSFISFFDTAISQEHASIVKYLCEKCTESNDEIQAIYKEALADDKIFEALNKQKIMKKTTDEISGEKNARNAKAKEIYDLVLTTASHTGNVELITKILKKIESVPTDEDKQKFLRHSLEIILERGTDGTISLIEISNLTDESVRKIYNEVRNEKVLANKVDNTIIGKGHNSIEEVNRMNESNLNEKKQKQLKNAIESCNLQEVTNCLNNDATVSDAVIKVFLKKDKSKNLSSEQRENLVEIANLLLEKLKNNPNRNEDKLQSFIAKYQVEENKSQQQQSSSSDSSNESDSSFDQVQNPVTVENIEGNQSVTTREESPLTSSDGELETPPSSKGSSFSVIDSAKSTSDDEDSDDNTLVESQSQENVSTGKKAVETGKVDGEVEGLSTEEGDQNEDKKDVQSDTEGKVVEQVEAPIVDSTSEEQLLLNTGERTGGNEQNQKSDDSFTSIDDDAQLPIDQSTPTSTRTDFVSLDSMVSNESTHINQTTTSDKATKTDFTGDETTETGELPKITHKETEGDQPKILKQPVNNTNTDSENTKRSAASIVAISTLAIAAAALVAASIYFEVMLAAGAIAGACCLAAAVITYFYTQPSTSIKDTEVDERKSLNQVVG